MQITAIGKRLPILSRQKLLVMKMLLIFTVASCLYANASVTAQTVTLKTRQSSLEKVLREVRKQTGYDFVFNNSVLSAAKPVTINATQMDLATFLQQCLKDQPLTYEILANKTIVIKEKKSSTLTEGLNHRLEAPPANTDVTITVLNTDGQPLEGASVTVKGNNKGLVTDINGRVLLRGVDPNATIVISFTGFQNQEVKISNRTSIGVRMVASTSELDEMQVIAYGKVSKRFNVGNVTTVKGEEIQRQPTGNPILALQGLVPGLFITQTNGIPGGGATVRIQGQNSIRNGGDPLYVVDGVPIASQQLLPFSGPLGSSGGLRGGGFVGGGSPLTYINPSDIESVEVLKDADATAIYGSRAANGAILITTKRGKAGQMKVDVNFQQGWGKVTKTLPMMNTQQYLQMRREAKLNDNAPILATDYDINGLWDTTRYTDWKKTLIGGTSQYTNINFGLSGGNNSVQYLVGGTYHKETTVFPGDFADEKASIHFSIMSVSANQRLKLLFSGSYLSDNNHLPSTDLTQLALLLSPNAPSLYKADGTLNWAPTASGSSSWTNPLAALLVPFDNKTGNLIANSTVSYHLFSGLDIKTSIGYNNIQTYIYQAYNVISATLPENRATTNRQARYAFLNSNSLTIEPQLTYKKKLGMGVLDILIGGTILQNKNNITSVQGVGHASDAVMENIASAATLTNFGSSISEYKYNAGFGRLNYNWREKYIIDLNGRRDGSSRFGPENRFHNFWSAGTAWIFSQEKPFQKYLSFLSFGKIKASYGTTGSDQIADYAYLNLYSQVFASLPYQGTVSYIPSSLFNPLLAWEETNKLQIGTSLGFLKDRILFNASWSRNRCGNQLLLAFVPATTGFSAYQVNLPATVENTSWEISLNTVNLKTKTVNWTSSFNLTIPNNKLIEFKDLNTSPFSASYIIGEPISFTKVYTFGGVDPATGGYMFKDRFGNAATALSPLDQNKIVTSLPKYFGGFTNSLSYENFQIDFTLQFTKQIGQNIIYASTSTGPGSLGSGGSNNQPVYVLDNHWQKPGDNAAVRKFSSTAPLGAIAASDASWMDASYIRLKNLSVSYGLPDKWKRKAHIQNCRVYFQAQNLLTITRYKGNDPENQGIGALPPLRVITLGFQMEL